jgi:hypothetical protein
MPFHDAIDCRAAAAVSNTPPSGSRELSSSSVDHLLRTEMHASATRRGEAATVSARDFQLKSGILPRRLIAE